MKATARLRYFAASLRKTLNRRGLSCPSCGGLASGVVCRKHLVTALRRCQACSLLFRSPTDAIAESTGFYQNEYCSGFTTELPTERELAVYLSNGFKATPKDFGRYVDILEALGCRHGDQLLDFGCSWGYGSWQLAQHGFVVTGFDISSRRVGFARRQLGVHATTRLEDIEDAFDVFFAAHTLEHVPSVQAILDFAFRRLREGGLFVAITPNGSSRYRAANPKRWKRSWGLKHPGLLDEVFYGHALRGRSAFVTSELRDIQSLRDWSHRLEPKRARLDGPELLAVCRKQSVG